jgi:hypothetical protein
LEILRDVIQLGNLLAVVPCHLVLHVIEGQVCFLAGIESEESADLRVAESPGSILVFVIVNPGDLWVLHFVPQRSLGDLPSPCHVLRVFEAGVVDFLDAVSFSQDLLADMIEVLDVGREPWNFDCF